MNRHDELSLDDAEFCDDTFYDEPRRDRDEDPIAFQEDWEEIWASEAENAEGYPD